MSLYDEFVPPLAHALGALSRVLDKAEDADLTKTVSPGSGRAQSITAPPGWSRATGVPGSS